MPESSAQERTEQATPRRRTEARRKGTVARSADLTSAVVIAALLFVLPYAAVSIGKAMMLGLQRGLGGIPRDVEPQTIAAYFWSVLQPAALSMAPVILVAMFVGLGVNYAQVGFVVSSETLSPSLAKINPANGFKRLFSRVAAFEGLKTLVKSALFGYLAFSVVSANWDQLLNLSGMSATGSLAFVGGILQTILIRVAIAWLILAAVDYFFQRRQVEKQLMMTREELKHELKDMEQSPELRTVMAQRRRRLIKGRLASAIKGADVVVTNPQHYAVAIEYDPKKMHAPQVVAKGADYLALKIRELAADNKVPLVPNPPLARQLYKKCEVGDFVPRDLFQAVAEVLAFVYATLKRAKKK
jgi:flagellar biosynthetic protein FlhB